MGVWGCFSEDNFQNTQAFTQVIAINAFICSPFTQEPLWCVLMPVTLYSLTGKLSTVLQALPCPADVYCLGRDRRYTAFYFQIPFRCLEVERRPA